MDYSTGVYVPNQKFIDIINKYNNFLPLTDKNNYMNG